MNLNISKEQANATAQLFINNCAGWLVEYWQTNVHDKLPMSIADTQATSIDELATYIQSLPEAYFRCKNLSQEKWVPLDCLFQAFFDTHFLDIPSLYYASEPLAVEPLRAWIALNLLQVQAA